MRLFYNVILLICVTFIVGCVATNDFKVLDALVIGMVRSKCDEIINDYGFTRTQSLERPNGGWFDTDDSWVYLSNRAKMVEEELGEKVVVADYYPVAHGLLGFGQLFLFYDADGKLIWFFRKQIN